MTGDVPWVCSRLPNNDFIALLVIGAVLLGLSIWRAKRKESASSMRSSARILMVVSVVALAGVVLALKQGLRQATRAVAGRTETAPAPVERKLPRLVDLGADKCIPCKMMAPILEEMKKDYAAQLQVDSIDVWKNNQAGAQYGIRVIPTQIFFDAAGKERFRHEGFISKEDILGKWKEFGVELAKPAGK